MAAPQQIQQLVETFADNLDAYRSDPYNETQLRREFLDPFFLALGWDVNNTQGYAEAYKDVIHEDSIKIGSATKAPDYCFRIGGTRKFFLEAKKPSVDIEHDIHPAFQLRRYAWSAKVPDEKTRLQRQITTTDNQIDRLVYELYNLTDEEIRIVEESTR